MRKFSKKYSEYIIAKAEGYSVALCYCKQLNYWAVLDTEISLHFIKRANLEIICY